MEQDIKQFLENNDDKNFIEIVKLLKILIKRKYIKSLKIDGNFKNNNSIEKYIENINKIHEYGLLDHIFLNSEDKIENDIIDIIRNQTSKHKVRIKGILDDDINISNLDFALEIIYNSEVKKTYNAIAKKKKQENAISKLEEYKRVINESIPKIIENIKEIEKIESLRKQTPKFPHLIQRIIVNKDNNANGKKTNELFENITFLIKTIKKKSSELYNKYFEIDTNINEIFENIKENYAFSQPLGLKTSRELKEEYEKLKLLVNTDSIRLKNQNKKLFIPDNVFKAKLEETSLYSMNYISILLNENKYPNIRKTLKTQILVLKLLQDIKTGKDIRALFPIIENDLDVILLKTLITPWTNQEQLRLITNNQEEIIKQYRKAI